VNPILSTGAFIGVACAVWMFVYGFTGWYRDPSMAWTFFAVIPIEIAGLVYGLRQTAREGRAYAGQIVAGTLMAIVGGVIIIVASLVFVLVVFPDALVNLQAADPSVTPMSQALGGFLGTLITGGLASALIAIRVRGGANARRGWRGGETRRH
jgi:hypothetical protein